MENKHITLAIFDRFIKYFVKSCDLKNFFLICYGIHKKIKKRFSSMLCLNCVWNEESHCKCCLVSSFPSNIQWSLEMLYVLIFFRGKKIRCCSFGIPLKCHHAYYFIKGLSENRGGKNQVKWEKILYLRIISSLHNHFN